jgi:hypothetical protein
MLVVKNIEDDVPFKGEGIVTPCFPQIVNITELAKDYGKTHKHEYVLKMDLMKKVDECK